MARKYHMKKVSQMRKPPGKSNKPCSVCWYNGRFWYYAANISIFMQHMLASHIVFMGFKLFLPLSIPTSFRLWNNCSNVYLKYAVIYVFTNKPLFKVIFCTGLIGLGVSLPDYWSWDRGCDSRHFHNVKICTSSGTGSTQHREGNPLLYSKGADLIKKVDINSQLQKSRWPI